MAIILDLGTTLVGDVTGLPLTKADGAPVRLVELGGPRETMLLANKNMPETGVEIRDSLRVNKRHNAGTDTATMHVMGMEYDDIVLRGRFRDPLDNFSIGGARRRVDLLRGLHHRRNPCRLEWGENILRQGLVLAVKFTNYLHNDIGYEITFSVSSAGEVGAQANNEVVLSRRQERMDAALRMAADGLDAMIQTISTGAVAVRFVQTFTRRRGT